LRSTRRPVSLESTTLNDSSEATFLSALVARPDSSGERRRWPRTLTF